MRAGACRRYRRAPAGGPVSAGAVVGAAGVLLGSCGGGSPPLTAAQIIHSDAVARSVEVTATAAYNGGNGEMNFDGYANGRMRLHVPLGWLVEVHCRNDSQLLLHSCAIIHDLPPSLGTRPLAFPEASSPDPATGSRPGTASTFEFLANHLGTYRLACLVHGHEIDGMWDYLVIDQTTAPSVEVAR